MHIHDVHTFTEQQFSQGRKGGEHFGRLAAGCDLNMFTASGCDQFRKTPSCRSHEGAMAGLHECLADIDNTAFCAATFEGGYQLQDGERMHAGNLNAAGHNSSAGVRQRGRLNVTMLQTRGQ
jgi:hypothetical protein